ncbi:hypothetical protein CJU90_4482 [Yarrowia sp. C11]|nr:hypothetical protein CJU90_4482 [Yarrowia sp. C11]
MTADDETSARDLASLLEGLSKLEIEHLASEDNEGNSGSDDLFVTLLQLVDEYEHLTSCVCEELKQGHLDVAKANYDNFMAASTFNSRISRFSYDERPQNAQITVSRESGVFTIHKDEKEAKTDPIRMFGLMPPYTLRTAQGHFQKAVDMIVELANVKSRLEALESKIQPVETEERVVDKKDNDSSTKEKAADTAANAEAVTVASADYL